ncbi:MAG: hypothetical protein KDD94_01510 [Calditrichaeota bacterium]|nr:hypothetical protein [Calditrichota bacterium]
MSPGNFSSDIVLKYQISGVPATYLIDPEGKIIADRYLNGKKLSEKPASLSLIRN